MVCEKCSKNHATVHLTEIVNNVKREAHLCEDCARNAGVVHKINFSIQDLLAGLMSEVKTSTAQEKMSQLRCPQCGITYADFRNKARLGCANDYEVFKAGLEMLLQKIHGATRHVGKVPPTASTQLRKENELVRLKRDLDQAVKEEQFEKAAGIRDRLRKLEAELDPNK